MLKRSAAIHLKAQPLLGSKTVLVMLTNCAASGRQRVSLLSVHPLGIRSVATSSPDLGSRIVCGSRIIDWAAALGAAALAAAVRVNLLPWDSKIKLLPSCDAVK